MTHPKRDLPLAVALGALVPLAFLVLSACGSDEESNDAPRDDAPVANATVIAMPDEYSNVAAKCFGTDMIYTARNVGTPPGRAVAVSPHHPWCEDGVLTKQEQEN